MRLVYLGTPEAAVEPLRALVEVGHDIALVVTQPDRRRSRRGHDEPSPVKRAALELGLPVRTPTKANEVLDEIAASGAEVGVVVAFGQLLRPALLAALPLGFVNVHFSLLPRWRGAAPVERAILAGDAETGVCLMQIDEGPDTGPVYACARVTIDDTDTTGSLRTKLVDAGSQLLLEHLPKIAELVAEPQAGTPTYADKLSGDDFHLEVTRPLSELLRIVRAGDPGPGAWFRAGGERYKVFGPSPADARLAPAGTVNDNGLGTATGTLQLREIQPAG